MLPLIHFRIQKGEVSGCRAVVDSHAPVFHHHHISRLFTCWPNSGRPWNCASAKQGSLRAVFTQPVTGYNKRIGWSSVGVGSRDRELSSAGSSIFTNRIFAARKRQRFMIHDLDTDLSRCQSCANGGCPRDLNYLRSIQQSVVDNVDLKRLGISSGQNCHPSGNSNFGGVTAC